MSYTTHITLLSRLSEGLDFRAWQEFHDRYIDLIRGVARRYGLQIVDCEDVAQEVLLDLCRSMKEFRYDPSKGRFRAYLKTVTLRKIFRVLSQKSRSGAQENLDQRVDSTSSDPEIDTLWEGEWRRHHIRRAMKRLAREFNERDRTAFTLYAMKGRGAEETAKLLSITVDHLYQVKSRILKRLSAVVAEQVEDEG